MIKQLELFADTQEMGVSDTETKLRRGNPNPCVQVYGRGEEGVQCKTCALLHRKRFPGVYYYKCDLRGDTSSRATDHRVNWDACAKYQGKG